MRGAARVFSGELNASTLICDRDLGHGRVKVLITPGGAACGEVFMAGVLTEVTGGTPASTTARLADPTGVTRLIVDRDGASAAEALMAAVPPLFVSVLGRGRGYRSGQTVTVSVAPDDVRVIGRDVRDSWCVRTAEATLERLTILEKTMKGEIMDEAPRMVLDHYHHTPASIHSLAAMARAALDAVKDPVPGSANHELRPILISLIRKHSGPRGIDLANLISLAKVQGIDETMVKKEIERLIADDECYQPSPGLIKIL